MKALFTLLVMLAILIACDAPKENKIIVQYTDLQATNFKGNINKIKVILYTCDSTGKIGEIQDCCTTIQEYNEVGNMYKQININKKGETVEEETKTFYPNGLVKTQITLQNGKTVRTIEAMLNDSGTYASLRFLDSAGQVQMYLTNMVVNEFAQPVSFLQYDKDSTLILKEDSKYDGNKLISYVQTYKDGQVIASYENKYNNKGECIESSVIQMTKNGPQKRVTKYTYEAYDKNGNFTQRTEWNERGEATSILKMEFYYRN